MKRVVTVVLVLSLLLLLFLPSCTRQGKVLRSVGACESEQFWTHGTFQDYTDFGVYTFSSDVDLSRNRYFAAVGEADIETLFKYIDHFEQWVENIRTTDPADELAVNYAFDHAIVDTEDYFYIYDDERYEIEFCCFDVWFFDTQTNTLYYFHDNI